MVTHFLRGGELGWEGGDLHYHQCEDEMTVLVHMYTQFWEHYRLVGETATRQCHVFFSFSFIRLLFSVAFPLFFTSLCFVLFRVAHIHLKKFLNDKVVMWGWLNMIIMYFSL